MSGGEKAKLSFFWWGYTAILRFAAQARRTIFLLGYGVNGFSDLYSGCHECDKQNMRFSFYRFNIPDPIFFYESIRVTWQQIGAIDSHLFRDQKKLYFLQMKNGESYMKTDGSVLDIPALNNSQIKPILFERRTRCQAQRIFIMHRITPRLNLLVKASDMLYKGAKQ